MDAGVVRIAIEVAVDPQPLHLAAAQHLRLPDHGCVVLRHARDDAGRAAGADRLIDREAPRVALVLVVIVVVQRQRRWGRLAEVLREFRVGLEVRDRSGADDGAAFHRMVALGDGERQPIAGLSQHGARSDPRRTRRADRVRVESDAVGHTARTRTSVPEMHGHGVRGVTGLHEDRCVDRAAAVRDLDHVFGVEAETPGGRRRQDGGVVPREFRERPRQFLQPAHVREAAVVHRRVGREHDLETVGLRGQRWRRRHGARGRHGVFGPCRAGDDAVVQALAPELLEVLTGGLRLRLPVLTNGVVRRTLGPLREHRHDIVGGVAAVERLHERLYDRGAPVERPRVAPMLEIVRLVDVPLAERGRLVVVEREVRANRHLLQRIRELQVGGRRVDGIAAEDHEQLHLAAVHVGDQLAERLRLIGRQFPPAAPRARPSPPCCPSA